MYTITYWDKDKNKECGAIETTWQLLELFSRRPDIEGFEIRKVKVGTICVDDEVVMSVSSRYEFEQVVAFFEWLSCSVELVGRNGA